MLLIPRDSPDNIDSSVINRVKYVVFHLARLECNPYLKLLNKELERQNICVRGGEYQSKSIFFIARVLATGKPEIFHIHDIHYFLQGRQDSFFLAFYHEWVRRNIKFIFFIIQIFILKLIGVKIVWTVHEWTDKYTNGQQNLLTYWNVLLGRAFDAIITHCNFTKDIIANELMKNRSHKVFSLYHGNYINAYPNNINRHSSRQDLNISQDKLVFILFGNIFPSKGFVTAIRQFQRLKHHNVFLLIVGRPENPEIKDLIDQEITNSNNIQFIAHQIPDENIQIYMNASDCVVLPYQVFTTSGVAILAMSFAKACIAPRLGYFNEVFDDVGTFFYDLDDTNGLFNAMQQAIAMQDNLVVMGEHNLHKVTQWSWNYVADATLKVYQQCIQTSKNSRIGRQKSKSNFS